MCRVGVADQENRAAGVALSESVDRLRGCQSQGKGPEEGGEDGGTHAGCGRRRRLFGVLSCVGELEI